MKFFFYYCYKSKKIEYQGKIITIKEQEEIINVDDDEKNVKE